MSTLRVGDVAPRFRDGWIVIDARATPNLRHAIGSRIYLSKRAASAACMRAQFALPGDAAHLHVVPVEGINPVFAMPDIDASGIIIAHDGALRLAAPEP